MTGLSARSLIFGPVTRLKDLVYRSALRRGAGEHQVGLPSGMDYQLFEVTNLPIPAGTDWSAQGHVFGTFTAHPSQRLDWWLFIEAAFKHRNDRELALGGDVTQVFEVTNLFIPAGTDWHLDGHVLGTLEVPAGSGVLMWFYIEVSAPLANGDIVWLAEWPTPGHASGSADYGAMVRAADTGTVFARAIAFASLPAIGSTPILQGASVPGTPSEVQVSSTQQVGLFTPGPIVNNITVVRARAAFLVT